MPDLIFNSSGKSDEDLVSPGRMQPSADLNSVDRNHGSPDFIDSDFDKSDVAQALRRQHRVNLGYEFDPPSTYQVPDLRQDFQLSDLQKFSFESAAYAEFSPKFFEDRFPLHDDFEKKKIMPLKTYVCIVVGVLLFITSPITLMVIFLGSYIHGEVVAPFFIAILFLLVALAVHYREQAVIAVAWKRYATWILENAELREVHAECLEPDENGIRTIELSYPNGCRELLKIIDYENTNILKQLKHNETVGMFREWFGQSAVVILQMDTHRIWCTNGRSKKRFRF